MTLLPPLRCAVLIEAEAEFLEVGALAGHELLHVNGDIAEARATAARWAEQNPGRRAIVCLYDDHVQATTTLNWAKAL